jgi:hypothetical protein
MSRLRLIDADVARPLPLIRNLTEDLEVNDADVR